MKIQLVVLFAFIALFVSGYGQEQTKQTYCGRRLSQALAWLCENEYNANLVKRSNYNAVDFGYEPEFTWPWMAGAKPRGLPDFRSLSDPHGLEIHGLADAHGLTDARGLTDPRGLSGPKGKRQIVEECCLQPCTIDVLLTYCG